MRKFDKLKMNENGKPITRLPPTKQEVTQFEKHFNIRIPKDYLDFLLYSNGGHPELDSIEPIGGDYAARWAIDHFYHLNSKKDDCNSLWLAMSRWRPIVGDARIPFAENGGGSPFLLDLSTTVPKVIGCLHDEYFRIVDISPSFPTFLDSLHVDPDAI